MISRRRFLGIGSGALTTSLLGLGCRPPAAQPDEYDVCIIGSGFAGTFLGLRLIERGIKTIIVEAGAALTAGASREGRTSLFPWRGRGEIAFPMDSTRSIALGGTSWRWAGFVSRLLPSDFRARSEFGSFPEWPLAYEDLVTYYCEAERALGTSGGAMITGAEPPRQCAYPFESAAYESPAHFFRPRRLAFFPNAFSSRNGNVRPIRLAEVELPRFAAAASATLRTERPVTRLVTKDGKRISQIETRRPDGSIELVRARHYVVAAGVMESARLLLASTSTWFPKGIGNATGLLGTHFNAHPRFQRLLTWPAGTRAGRHRTLSFDPELRRAGLGTFLFDLRFDPDEPSRNLLNVIIELEPSAFNRITLSGDATDAWGRPVASVHMDWSAIDRQTIARALVLHRELWSAVSRTEAPIAAPLPVWFHPAGGCRMGTDPAAGVVDRDCRVFGVDNLYVSGASVFPTSGSGNPVLTVVALALRLGDHLLERLGRV